jgi:hypothetical protein
VVTTTLLHVDVSAGVYTGATTQLGHAAHSHTFLIFGAIATCVHVIMWLVVIALTAVNAWSGRLFHAPCLTQSEAAHEAAAAAAAAASVAAGASEESAAGLERKLRREASKVEEQLQQPATGDSVHGRKSRGHHDADAAAAIAAARDICEDEEAAIGRSVNVAPGVM